MGPVRPVMFKLIVGYAVRFPNCSHLNCSLAPTKLIVCNIGLQSIFQLIYRNCFHILRTCQTPAICQMGCPEMPIYRIRAPRQLFFGATSFLVGQISGLQCLFVA